MEKPRFSKIVMYILQLVACVAAAIACSIYYEYGYLNYFGVSFNFIQVSLISVAFYFFVILLFNISLVFVFLPIGKSIERPFGRVSIKTIFYLFPVFFAFKLYGFDISQYWWILYITLPIILIEWIFAMMDMHSKFVRFMKNCIETGKEHNPLCRTVHFIQDHADDKFRFISIFMLFLISLSYLNGRSVAEYKKDFHLIPAQEPMAVIRIYNNKLICAPVDIKKKIISPYFYIFKVKKENVSKDLGLLLSTIGPLKATR